MYIDFLELTPILIKAGKLGIPKNLIESAFLVGLPLPSPHLPPEWVPSYVSLRSQVLALLSWVF
jgi:hypothetical protein